MLSLQANSINKLLLLWYKIVCIEVSNMLRAFNTNNYTRVIYVVVVSVAVMVLGCSVITTQIKPIINEK